MSFDLSVDARIRNTFHHAAHIITRNHRNPRTTEGDAISLQTRGQSQNTKQDGAIQNGGPMEDGGDAAYYQPLLWWFASIAFPLIAGTFGPIANLFSVCALVQTWRVAKPDNTRIGDPAWVLTLNIASLVCALIANLLLLFNFAKRIPYRIAQPLTILPWYISCVLLAIPVAITRRALLHKDPSYTLSESYYYGLIAAIIYFILSTLLLLNLSGTYIFHAYPPTFASLTIPQRTLMLQTISFSCYLALGAGVFAGIEGWQFVDGLYWADYTLLTIGIGSDFPLKKTAARMLLIPYAAVGVTSVGLIISSVRGLVLERGKARITKRMLEEERKRCEAMMEGGASQHGFGTFPKSGGDKGKRVLGTKVDGRDGDHHLWGRKEFELMRHVEKQAKRFQEYVALLFSVFVFVTVWVGGSIVFWALEHGSASWTYPESLYFAYTSIFTIGYGDFYPSTSASRPFFVIWSLVAIPAVTVLISNMGETVFRAIDRGTVWVGQRSILPERKEDIKKIGRVRPRLGTGKERDSEKGKAKKRDTRANDGDRSQNGSPTPPPTSSSSSQQSRGHEQVRARRQSIAQAEERETEEETENETAEILGQQDSELTLTVRLAREIRRVAKDAVQRPSYEYRWGEWARWLRLMDEAEKILETPLRTNSSETGGEPNGGLGDEQADRRSEKSVVELWKWTWLGDRGPLFSSESETQWVLNRLCLLLEKVTQREARQMRK